MADVVTKAINANSVKNGSATTYVDKQGNIESKERGYETPSIAAIDAKLDNRLDNTRYYTGDATT